MFWVLNLCSDGNREELQVCSAISSCHVSCYLGAEVQGAVEGDKIPPNLFFSRLFPQPLLAGLFLIDPSPALLLFSGHNVFLVVRGPILNQDERRNKSC